MLKGKRVSFEGEQGVLPLRKLPSVPILSKVCGSIAFKIPLKCHKCAVFFSQIRSCRSQTNQTLPKPILKVILNKVFCQRIKLTVFLAKRGRGKNLAQFHKTGQKI